MGTTAVLGEGIPRIYNCVVQLFNYAIIITFLMKTIVLQIDVILLDWMERNCYCIQRQVEWWKGSGP